MQNLKIHVLCCKVVIISYLSLNKCQGVLAKLACSYLKVQYPPLLEVHLVNTISLL